jgi:transcriptional regulator with XRE-family HTH domain
MAKKGTHRDDDLHRILAENVRQLRLKTGLTQQELSRRCRLHHSYVGRLETTAPRNPGLDSIVKVARGLGVTVLDLFTRRDRAS